MQRANDRAGEITVDPCKQAGDGLLGWLAGWLCVCGKKEGSSERASERRNRAAVARARQTDRATKQPK